MNMRPSDFERLVSQCYARFRDEQLDPTKLPVWLNLRPIEQAAWKALVMMAYDTGYEHGTQDTVGDALA